MKDVYNNAMTKHTLCWIILLKFLSSQSAFFYISFSKNNRLLWYWHSQLNCKVCRWCNLFILLCALRIANIWTLIMWETGNYIVPHNPSQEEREDTELGEIWVDSCNATACNIMFMIRETKLECILVAYRSSIFVIYKFIYAFDKRVRMASNYIFYSFDKRVRMEQCLRQTSSNG